MIKNKKSIVIALSFLMSISSFADTLKEKDKLKVKVLKEVERGKFEPYEIEAEVLDGDVIYQGDIWLGSSYLFDKDSKKFKDKHTKKIKDPLILGLNGIISGTSSGGFWPYSEIKYRFNASLTSARQTSITNELDYMESVFGIRFTETSGTSGNYIEFTHSSSSCSSPVGMQGGKQTIKLADGCFNRSSIIHEALHTMGYYHEHSRKDRDTYIDVHYDNIVDNKEHNFTKQTFTPDTTYDTDSVMHYWSFVTDPNFVIDDTLPILSRKDGTAINPATDFSTGDTEELINDYGYTGGLNVSGIPGQYCGAGTIRWGTITKS